MPLPLVGSTRRNHAIEHATIAVLFRRRGRVVSVVGQSDPWGFFVRGPFTAEEVESAAVEALQRLRAGERHLAVTPLCGTNIVAGAVLAGGAALIAAGRSRRDNWSRALTAAMLASLGAGRAGLALQRHVTTDSYVDGVALKSVRAFGPDDGSRQVVRVRLAG